VKSGLCHWVWTSGGAKADPEGRRGRRVGEKGRKWVFPWEREKGEPHDGKIKNLPKRAQSGRKKRAPEREKTYWQGVAGGKKLDEGKTSWGEAAEEGKGS